MADPRARFRYSADQRTYVARRGCVIQGVTYRPGDPVDLRDLPDSDINHHHLYGLKLAVAIEEPTPAELKLFPAQDPDKKLRTNAKRAATNAAKAWARWRDTRDDVDYQKAARANQLSLQAAAMVTEGGE